MVVEFEACVDGSETPFRRCIRGAEEECFLGHARGLMNQGNRRPAAGAKRRVRGVRVDRRVRPAFELTLRHIATGQSQLLRGQLHCAH